MELKWLIYLTYFCLGGIAVYTIKPPLMPTAALRIYETIGLIIFISVTVYTLFWVKWYYVLIGQAAMALGASILPRVFKRLNGIISTLASLTCFIWMITEVF